MQNPPVIQPLIDLLRDKNFVTTLVGAIFAVLVNAVPSLAPYQATLTPMIVVLVLIAVGANVAQSVTAASVQKAQIGLQIAQAQAEAAKAAIQSATPISK